MLGVVLAVVRAVVLVVVDSSSFWANAVVEKRAAAKKVERRSDRFNESREAPIVGDRILVFGQRRKPGRKLAWLLMS